ncbi:HAD family phosphatase [Lichenihabitans sp. Uapishka_5]|uniref:HAD family hydrolase n=1 Tax=Lichenihabitans sp. Uapishka_5 TaxID=3037302 RepID=UPI0029E7E6D0|nr:HAD family phosphatase [Lichenihabitans sp. Uapishka_5]MDX7952760.1 HAD family phosphatase [Lichenihabitans sp. Uapishka_5]
MAQSSVSVVVFDIGNVLIEWDPVHLYAKLFPGRPEAMRWFLDTICTSAWNLEQDAGRPWAAGVGVLVERYPEWRAEIEAYDRRWHEMVPQVIAGSVAILTRLAEAGVPVYAITNFSSDKFIESAARFPFFATFKGVIVSADEALLKPHAPIFALLCSRYGVAASQCVFIDDNADNVEGARRAGMTALPFTDAPTLRQALQGLGLPA